MSNDHPDKIVLAPCILSYPSLFTKKVWKDQDDDKKTYYQTDLWFYDHDAAAYNENITKINQLQASMCAAKFPRGIPADFTSPYRALTSEQTRTDYKGFLIRVKSASPPGVYRKDPATGKFQTLTEDDIYPGLIVAANVSGYAYLERGKAGFSLWLNQIVVLRDGERIAQGASQSPEEAFGSEIDRYIGNFTGHADQAVQFAAQGGAVAPPQQQAAPPMPGYPQQQAAPPMPGYPQQQGQMPPGYPMQ